MRKAFQVRGGRSGGEGEGAEGRGGALVEERRAGMGEGVVVVVDGRGGGDVRKRRWMGFAVNDKAQHGVRSPGWAFMLVSARRRWSGWEGSIFEMHLGRGGVGIVGNGGVLWFCVLYTRELWRWKGCEAFSAVRAAGGYFSQVAYSD